MPANIFECIRNNDQVGINRCIERDQLAINTADQRGFTPLILSTYLGNEELSLMLINAGANIDAQDASGNTALMGVCFKGHHDMVSLLVDRKAGVNIRNYNGATALTFAATFGHLEIAQTLLNHGGDPTIMDHHGNSPIDHAKFKSNQPMLDLFNQFATQ